LPRASQKDPSFAEYNLNRQLAAAPVALPNNLTACQGNVAAEGFYLHLAALAAQASVDGCNPGISKDDI
jgi:hypothetical protein